MSVCAYESERERDCKYVHKRVCVFECAHHWRCDMHSLDLVIVDHEHRSEEREEHVYGTEQHREVKRTKLEDG